MFNAAACLRADVLSSNSICWNNPRMYIGIGIPTSHATCLRRLSELHAQRPHGLRLRDDLSVHVNLEPFAFLVVCPVQIEAHRHDLPVHGDPVGRPPASRKGPQANVQSGMLQTERPVDFFAKNRAAAASSPRECRGRDKRVDRELAVRPRAQPNQAGQDEVVESGVVVLVALLRDICNNTQSVTIHPYIVATSNGRT